jgi:thymidine phosphorylase
MDTRQIAMAIVKLGGGRQHPNDRVDHRVGVDGVIALGGRVERGDAMAVVHAADMDSARFAAKVIQQAVTVRDTQPPAAPIVLAHCRA